MSEDLPQRISEDTVTGYCQKECQKECEKIWECQKISKNYMQLRRAARQWTYTAYNTKMLALELHDIRLMRLFQSFFFEKEKMYRNAPCREWDQKKLYCQKICQKQNQTRECQETMSEKMWANMSDEMPEMPSPWPHTAPDHRSSQVITGHHRSSPSWMSGSVKHFIRQNKVWRFFSNDWFSHISLYLISDLKT